jgi:hypothetical protein
VVIESLSAPPNSFSLEAVDWQTGTVLWRNQSAAERNGLVPEVQAQDEPNADAIALTTVPNPGAPIFPRTSRSCGSSGRGIPRSN